MNEDKPSVTLTISWILLLTMSVLTTLAGLASLFQAYWGAGEVMAGQALYDLAKSDPALVDALRGRRATAAAYAVTCGLLLGWVTLTAYRKRARWAWFAVLTSIGLGTAASAIRYFILDSSVGGGVAVTTLAVTLVALAISYRDFK